MMTHSAFTWRDTALDILDQRLLPGRTETLSCRTPQEVADAIRDMAVRGAPAIGCCAAYGLVLAWDDPGLPESVAAMGRAAEILKKARPTAVNLAWAVDRVLASVLKSGATDRAGLRAAALEAARSIEAEDAANNLSIGRHGATLLKPDSIVMTHCNAGALATAGHGTALGIIRQAFKEGKVRKVFVNETRPWLQGSRLTAWELSQERIPFEIITDGMAAHVMKTERIAAVFTGADRVAMNGDTANKIGTYSLAVAARYHHVPFYVAMPLSTLDLSTPDGSAIPIEDRSADEVLEFAGIRVAPAGAKARHPAFDVTPGGLITGIVTERGLVKAPFRLNLPEIAAVTAAVATRP